jgi:uncharacterized protein (DUF1330 family)
MLKSRSPILSFTVFMSCLLLETVSHAQDQASEQKPAYYISEFTVTDPEGIKPYSAQVETTFVPFSGRYIVRGGGDIASLEGTGFDGRMVVIKFDSLEKAQAWYTSPEYEKIKPIRHKSATSRVYIVEGLAN